jgi:hypothetical protein
VLAWIQALGNPERVQNVRHSADRITSDLTANNERIAQETEAFAPSRAADKKRRAVEGSHRRAAGVKVPRLVLRGETGQSESSGDFA